MGKEYKQASLEEDDTVPVAHAELLRIDGIEEVLPLDDNEKEEATSWARVVAPCDLPPNYKLLVNANDGTTFEVLVPKSGAQQNKPFYADKWQPNPIEGRFGDNLLDCGYEGTCWCLIACHCIGLAIGGVMEKLQLDWCANPSMISRSKYTFAIVAFLWFVYITTHIIRLGTGVSDVSNQAEIMEIISMSGVIYFIVILTKTRMVFRSKYKISGNCCTDCLVSYFCTCCATLQMYRHMKRSGDRPARFESRKGVEYEIV